MSLQLHPRHVTRYTFYVAHSMLHVAHCMLLVVGRTCLACCMMYVRMRCRLHVARCMGYVCVITMFSRSISSRTFAGGGAAAVIMFTRCE